MGAWGVKLYSSDIAVDVKSEYIDQLRRGKTNEEITNNLIEENIDIISDEEEGPEFWFALADTQWNYGRLLPAVKENALKWLNQEGHLEIWKESSMKNYNARIVVLNELKIKLLSPMPQEKKISRYNLYKCQWKIGDVFAYKFTGEYSCDKGFNKKYVLFRKIGEDIYPPGHTMPIVHVYKWIGDTVPDISIVNKLTIIPQFYEPVAYKDLKTDKILYKLLLMSTSKRIIPSKNITHLGNIQDDEINSKAINERNEKHLCSWKYFEQYIIENYLKWENIDIL
ncbi:hypothetical protein [Clostridium cellulovorans]|uniref:Uncharacterized protein n=1 Tax=Clostridium cellulovorans (strain ATCC 35296 / DSM 3052 / OCM 3 / 743B) TaxID=573061 RepID=D9SRH9_CLOC7|nr:hypothetical protein [Clostridium cellulovorans]ADL52408.1 hypothetical protein Clocel_2709 [Clostridium cellulovorans 743B]